MWLFNIEMVVSVLRALWDTYLHLLIEILCVAVHAQILAKCLCITIQNYNTNKIRNRTKRTTNNQKWIWRRMEGKEILEHLNMCSVILVPFGFGNSLPLSLIAFSSLNVQHRVMWNNVSTNIVIVIMYVEMVLYVGQGNAYYHNTNSNTYNPNRIWAEQNGTEVRWRIATIWTWW